MPQASSPRWHLGILWTRLPCELPEQLGGAGTWNASSLSVLVLIISERAGEYWYLSYSRFIAGSVGNRAREVHCDCRVDVALRGMPRC